MQWPKEKSSRGTINHTSTRNRVTFVEEPEKNVNADNNLDETRASTQSRTTFLRKGQSVQRQSLNGTWGLTFGPQRANHPQSPDELSGVDWPAIEATVPGNVELDLMKSGILEDVSIGSRVYELRRYETYEWWFRQHFSLPETRPEQRVVLVFEGLDCLGTIWLNGVRIGETDNMFIAHRFDVTDHIRPKNENELVVRITSSVLESRHHKPEPYEKALAGGHDSLSIRKAPHMFGWDIMPRIVSAGLWRDVYMEIIEPTHWRTVYWTTLETDPEKRTATVFVDWDFETERSEIDSLSVRITLSRNGRQAHQSIHGVISTHGRSILSLHDVDLWWPRGAGEASLYDATLELMDGDGKAVDVHRCRIGIRTVELLRTDVSTIEKPGEFVFRLNSEKIFVKGTNWVPLDAFHSRDAQHMKKVFDMLVDLNCNMVRCWGGNVYEDHAFFDLCDESGVMVWQDFAFACHIYPQNDVFAGKVRKEAEAVVEKLRNHPALVLWAGNNEVDNAFVNAGLGIDPNTDRISRKTLSDVVLRLDPKRPYLPSSPFRSKEVVRRGNDNSVMPEVHLWKDRPYFKYPFYTAQPAHFVSEIGYHGCPERKSIETFLDPEYLWPWQNNDQWLTKAVRPLPSATRYNYRIPLMSEQIACFFDSVPDGLDDFIEASQITQAEALKFFVEWWRQGKWRRTGILWWNLRDGWPIFSDAIVDYYNRKKLAYSYIKRSQADVCVICGEPVEGRHPLFIVNDTLRSVRGHVAVRDADDYSVLLETNYEVDPNVKAVVGHLNRHKDQAMWLIEWTVGPDALRNHYLSGTPPFRLSDYRRWLEKIQRPDNDSGQTK
jgi:beta-mannosidase